MKCFPFSNDLLPFATIETSLDPLVAGFEGKKKRDFFSLVTELGKA